MNFSRRNFLVAATAFAASSSTAASALSSSPFGAVPAGGPAGGALPGLPRTPLSGAAVPPASSPGLPASPSLPASPAIRAGVAPALFDAAMAALDRHGGRVTRDRIGIVDFSASSSDPRLHLVDLQGGTTSTLHVAHGSGSDPNHTGWLQRFSNSPGSNATSEGAYLTSNYYFGRHGRSQRLIGLDPTNSNALDRAIVIHGAWYAEPSMIAVHGKLGRSQGCLAVGDSLLNRAFDHLGSGRMIYAAKMA